MLHCFPFVFSLGYRAQAKLSFHRTSQISCVIHIASFYKKRKIDSLWHCRWHKGSNQNNWWERPPELLAMGSSAWAVGISEQSRCFQYTPLHVRTATDAAFQTHLKDRSLSSWQKLLNSKTHKEGNSMHKSGPQNPRPVFSLSVFKNHLFIRLIVDHN